MTERGAPVAADRAARAAVHAALGDPTRLAVVDELRLSDRSPGELAERLDVAGNLLAHHLAVLEAAGIIQRFPSEGDRRRRYLRLGPNAAVATAPATTAITPSAPQAGHATTDAADGVAAGRPLFVCSANSARSQLAAALWTARCGIPAGSAGTRPADAVHPEALAAARRWGLDLAGARPRPLQPADRGRRVITVCDRANETLPADWHRWHWSIPDPVPSGRPAAFDEVVAALDRRIRSIAPEVTA